MHGSRPIVAPTFTAPAITWASRGANPRPVLQNPISPVLPPGRWLACAPTSPPVPRDVSWAFCESAAPVIGIAEAMIITSVHLFLSMVLWNQT